MAGTADRILALKLVTDVADMSRQLRTADRTMTRTVGRWDRHASRVNDQLDRMGRLVVPIASAFAAGAAVDFFSGAWGAARDAERATAQLELAIASVGGASDATRQKLEDLAQRGIWAGIGDEAVQDAVGMLTRRFGSLERGVAAADLAMEVAAATGRDYPEAAKLVARALEGNGRAMRELGIEGDTLAERMRSLRERYVGAVDRMADTTDVRLARAEQRWGEFQENVGTVMLGLYDDFATFSEQSAVPFLVFQTMFGTTMAAIDATAEQTAKDVPIEFGGMFRTMVSVARLALPSIQRTGQQLGAGVGNPLLDMIGSVTRAWNALMELFGAKPAGGGPSGGSPNAGPGGLNRGEGRGGNPFGGGGGPLGAGGRFIALADGGVAMGPTLAMIAEAGEPEAVIPLSRLREFVGGGGRYTVNVYASPGADLAATGRDIVRAIRAYEATDGKRWRS